MDDLVSPREGTVEVRWPRPGAALVVVAGEHDLASAAELDETLAAALAGCTHLIVDLSSAAFIDSSTIGVLVNAKRHADQVDRKFNLVLGSTPIVERVLEITGVLPGLNRVKTVDQALVD
jgi:anti-sigma B factor antagonist